MKPLVIATVFAPSRQNARWYALQKRFIHQHTDVPFDYWVILNGVNAAGFDPADVALVNEENLGHGEALMQALQLFREHRGHDAYLILDSDAFPIKHGWYGVLTEQSMPIRLFAKQGKEDCFARAPAAWNSLWDKEESSESRGDHGSKLASLRLFGNEPYRHGTNE